MRDVNPRGRERFDLSLDGRQIASIVVGAIVVLAVVFVLGLSVGKQIARREQEVRPAAGDALEALDQPVAPAPTVREESLTYHDRLVRERPTAAPAAAEPVRHPAEPPAAAPAPEPEPEPTAQPPVVDAAPPPAPSEPARAEPPAPAAGTWSVQVGAAQERQEAERLASRFERYYPRIETAEVQGTTWYRVRLGGFETRAAAEKYLKDLARETGVKGFVTTNR